MTRRPSLLALALGLSTLAAGCASGAEPSALRAPLTGEAVPAAVWQALPASCEGVEAAAELRRTDAPELGVLVDASGEPVCVDTLAALTGEHPLVPRASDPSPRPSDPSPRPSDPSRRPSALRHEPGLDASDPSPRP